jgi:hypothetical protein
MPDRDDNLPSSEDLVRAARENLSRPPSDATSPTSDVDVEPSITRPAWRDTGEAERRADPVTPTRRDGDRPSTTDAVPVEHREPQPDELALPEPPPPKAKRRWGLALIAFGDVIADSVEHIVDWAPDWIGDLFD